MFSIIECSGSEETEVIGISWEFWLTAISVYWKDSEKMDDREKRSEGTKFDDFKKKSQNARILMTEENDQKK